MPYDQLQANISRFQAYKNQVIIVYCKTGARSMIASEILANNSFTRVYNMVGGIFAWINAGYQIYTTYHYATVNVTDGKVLTHIEPLLLLQTGPPCTQNKTCSSGGNVLTYQSTVLKQNGTYTFFDITFNINGTIFEFTVARTQLWSWKEDTDGYNRSASFTSTEITGQNLFTQFYSLGYMVQCAKYNLTIQSVLTPLNSGAYNASLTTINSAPADKSGVVPFEFVDFNSSVTLSDQYSILGGVAQKLGNAYEKSGDEGLTRLAPSYHAMKEEAEYLSNLVETQLQEYNRLTMKSYAILVDPCTVDCWAAMFVAVTGANFPFDVLLCIFGCVTGCLPLLIWGFYQVCAGTCLQWVCGMAIGVDFLIYALYAAHLCGCY